MNERIAKLADEYFAREDIRAQAAEDLKSIVRVPSVAAESDGKYPYGVECARALDTAASLAEKYGFRVENHEYHCLSVLYGDSDREVGIVAHLDVVPAGDGWSCEPYDVTERDGLFIGRGTHDDKGPFIQSLYTLRFFRENGIKLPFTLRLILGSDEEVGSTDLEYFVTVRKPPMFSFTPDSEFPVCIGEKGILGLEVDYGKAPEGFTISGGTVSNAVAGTAQAVVKTEKALPEAENITLEKVCGGVKITATGKTAHAAMPEAGVNAINLLVSYLSENGLVSGEAFELIRRSTGEYLGETLGIAATDADFGYLTCVGGVISVRGGHIIQSYNIRYIPTTPYEDIVAAVERTVAPCGGSVSVVSQSDGYHVSAEDKKIKALTDACESVLGIRCEPYTMGGGTYARWLPNTVAFGSGIDAHRHYLGAERGNAHQRDEYIAAEEFFAGMNIYSRAIGNLSDIL